MFLLLLLLLMLLLNGCGALVWRRLDHLRWPRTVESGLVVVISSRSGRHRG